MTPIGKASVHILGTIVEKKENRGGLNVIVSVDDKRYATFIRKTDTKRLEIVKNFDVGEMVEITAYIKNNVYEKSNGEQKVSFDFHLQKIFRASGALEFIQFNVVGEPIKFETKQTSTGVSYQVAYLKTTLNSGEEVFINVIHKPLNDKIDISKYATKDGFLIHSTGDICRDNNNEYIFKARIVGECTRQ